MKKLRWTFSLVLICLLACGLGTGCASLLGGAREAAAPADPNRPVSIENPSPLLQTALELKAAAEALKQAQKEKTPESQTGATVAIAGAATSLIGLIGMFFKQRATDAKVAEVKAETNELYDKTHAAVPIAAKAA